jgi:hypothetical protein
MPLTKATQNVVEGIVSTGSTGVSAGSFIVGQQYKITSMGTTTEPQWNTIAGTTGKTYVVGSLFTAATTGTSSGTGAAAVSRNLQDRFSELVNVKDFNATGNGVADDTTPIRNAINSGAKRIYFPAGTYRVTSRISVTTNGITIFGDGDATILVNLPVNGSDSVFDVAGPGLQTPTTTATADFKIGNNVLSVASSASFAPGDLIRIVSTEYFNGSEGIAGYGIRTKGELSQIAQISGNNFTLSEAAKDNYTSAGNTITVRKYNAIRNIKITGLNFYGTGGGASHTSENPVGPRAIELDFIVNAEVSHCSFLNFPRFACTADNLKNLIITDNKFLGYDVNDPTNLPLPSDQWFTGFQVFSSENIIFSSNVGLNSRRSFDANSAGTGTAVCRNITIVNNTSIDCTNTVGTHTCDNVTVIGNTGIASGGIGIRGKNVVVSGNIISPKTATGTGISVGPTIDFSTTAIPEEPGVGHVVITNNILRGTWEKGVYVRFSADSAVISNNSLAETTTYGIAFGGVIIKNVSISNNIIQIPQDSSGIGIITANYTNNLVKEFDSFVVNANTIKLNGGGQAIAIAGGPKSNPAENIIITDNIITGDGLRHIGFVGTGTGNNTGFVGLYVTIRGNICNGTVTEGEKIIGNSRAVASPLANNNMLGTGLWASIYDVNSGANPTSNTTYRTGMQIGDSDPTTGGYIGKVCTRSGTTGTLTGVTGSINNGSTLLTVSSVESIQIGHYLAVSGSGLPVSARVTGINGLVCTMSNPATATVSGAAVTRREPLFNNFGAIL